MQLEISKAGLDLMAAHRQGAYLSAMYVSPVTPAEDVRVLIVFCGVCFWIHRRDLAEALFPR